jgi:hypothetical protein
MGISHTLSRRFFWGENILWKEDLRYRRVTVVLGGKDLIVDTEAVAAYLMGAEYGRHEMGSWRNGVWKGNELDVLLFRDLDHSQVFDKKSTRMRLVDIVRKYCMME